MGGNHRHRKGETLQILSSPLSLGQHKEQFYKVAGVSLTSNPASLMDWKEHCSIEMLRITVGFTCISSHTVIEWTHWTVSSSTSQTNKKQEQKPSPDVCLHRRREVSWVYDEAALWGPVGRTEEALYKTVSVPLMKYRYYNKLFCFETMYECLKSKRTSRLYVTTVRFITLTGIGRFWGINFIKFPLHQGHKESSISKTLLVLLLKSTQILALWNLS